MLGVALALLPVGIWSYLAFGRGGFWRVRPHLPEAANDAACRRRITAVIPARDEAVVIREAVGSLLRQDLEQPVAVIVVDDHSSDGTADVVKTMDGVTVIPGAPVEPGWTPKLWAMQQGVSAAATSRPDYLLFTDADIVHGEQSIRRLVATAESRNADLASYMVKLATDTPAERMLIPAFVYFFFQLYPPAWSGSERHSTAGAAGGCILIRPAALRRAGGLEAIRNKVIDDCALAAVIKQSGGRLWLGLTEESRSIRSYGGFGGVGQMIARLAFYQLRHSYVLLALTLAGLTVTYMLPPILIGKRKRFPALCGASAWLLMSLTYAPVVRFYRRPLWQALTLPLAAVFYAGATVYSAWQYTRGKGGRWKGRIQDRPRS